MTDLQLFAFVVLPLVLVAGGGMLLLVERRGWRTANPELKLVSPRHRPMPDSDGLGAPGRSQRAD